MKTGIRSCGMQQLVPYNTLLTIMHIIYYILYLLHFLTEHFLYKYINYTSKHRFVHLIVTIPQKTAVIQLYLFCTLEPSYLSSRSF